MPRTYKKKTVSKYSDATLQLALLDVEQGKSIHSAAKEHKIPYETLRRWVTNRPSHRGPGRSTYLSFEEEHCIVEGLKFLAMCGFPFDRKDVQNLIITYFKNSKMKNPFPNGCPGIDFMRAFENRWSKELGRRKPELLTAARAKDLSLVNVNNFFKMYVKLLHDNKLQNSPGRIFNLDEIGLGTDPRSAKVFIGKSSRIAYMKSPDAGKAMYSVLFCVSASGAYMPPFVIYKGLRLYNMWTVGGLQGTLYGCTESGWMMDNVFESWIKRFIEYVKEIQKPVLLIYDGHGSHLTYYTIMQAMDNGIILLCLPPNSSHAIQPLDVGVFAPLKKSWKDVLKTWFRESRQQNVSKATFPYLLKKLFNFLKPINAVKGFEGTRIFPANKEKVEHRILLTEKDTSNMTEDASTSFQLVSPSTSLGQSCSSTLLGQGIPRKTQDHTDLTTSKIGLVCSPFKDLKSAILSTLTPPQSSLTTLALQNSKRSRKRVQSKVGEVLTEETVAQRLLWEEEERQKKKRKISGKSIRNMTSRKQKVKKIIKPLEAQVAEVNRADFKLGSWVAVKYEGKRSTMQFIGQITEEVGNMYEVKFLTKCGQNYSFPITDDIDLVTVNSIARVLEEPTVDNRGHYSFPTL